MPALSPDPNPHSKQEGKKRKATGKQNFPRNTQQTAAFVTSAKIVLHGLHYVVKKYRISFVYLLKSAAASGKMMVLLVKKRKRKKSENGHWVGN